MEVSFRRKESHYCEGLAVEGTCRMKSGTVPENARPMKALFPRALIAGICEYIYMLTFWKFFNWVRTNWVKPLCLSLAWHEVSHAESSEDFRTSA